MICQVSVMSPLKGKNKLLYIKTILSLAHDNLRSTSDLIKRLMVVKED